jgi:4-azaleucine resistance transporter AzlC
MKIVRLLEGLPPAAKTAGVVWLGLLALGLGFGVLTRTTGFDWWVAPVMSAVIFAGSAEFILVGLFAVATPLAVIAATAALVNSRHLFYGLSFPIHKLRGRGAKTYGVYALVDEAYVMATSPAGGAWSGRQLLWTQAGLHVSWVLGALTGSLAGPTLLSGLSGLDFVLTALFLILAVDAVDASRDAATATIAVVAGVIAHLIAPEAMLIVAISLFTVGILLRYAAKEGARSHA